MSVHDIHPRALLQQQRYPPPSAEQSTRDRSPFPVSLAVPAATTTASGSDRVASPPVPVHWHGTTADKFGSVAATAAEVGTTAPCVVHAATAVGVRSRHVVGDGHTSSGHHACVLGVAAAAVGVVGVSRELQGQCRS